MALTLSTIFRLRRTRAMIPHRYRIPSFPSCPQLWSLEPSPWSSTVSSRGPRNRCTARQLSSAEFRSVTSGEDGAIFSSIIPDEPRRLVRTLVDPKHPDMTEVRKGSRRTHELFSKAATNVGLRTYPLAHAMREIRFTKLVRGAEWWNSRISVEDLNDARTPRK